MIKALDLSARRFFESIHAPSSGAFWHRSSNFACVSRRVVVKMRVVVNQSNRYINSLWPQPHIRAIKTVVLHPTGDVGGQTHMADFPRVFGEGWGGGSRVILLLMLCNPEDRWVLDSFPESERPTLIVLTQELFVLIQKLAITVTGNRPLKAGGS